MWKNYMLAALNVAVAGLPFGSVKEFSQKGLQGLA